MGFKLVASLSRIISMSLSLLFSNTFSYSQESYSGVCLPPELRQCGMKLNQLVQVLSVTEYQISILHFLYGKNFERATRIVDQKGVKRISGQPSGRSIFQVVGESRKKEEYFCFPEHFCACYSFFFDIVSKGEQLCCKHQLAARLAASLKSCIEVEVSDEQLALLLSRL